MCGAKSRGAEDVGDPVVTVVQVQLLDNERVAKTSMQILRLKQTSEKPISKVQKIQPNIWKP